MREKRKTNHDFEETRSKETTKFVFSTRVENTNCTHSFFSHSNLQICFFFTKIFDGIIKAVFEYLNIIFFPFFIQINILKITVCKAKLSTLRYIMDGESLEQNNIFYDGVFNNLKRFVNVTPQISELFLTNVRDLLIC